MGTTEGNEFMTDLCVPAAEALREIPVARVDDPQEVAEVIAFLFPDDSPFGEGHLLSVTLSTD